MKAVKIKIAAEELKQRDLMVDKQGNAHTVTHVVDWNDGTLTIHQLCKSPIDVSKKELVTVLRR